MADTNKNTTPTNAKNRKVFVTLPLKSGYNANQDEYVAINGKPYMIQRGAEVEISEAVAEVIRNGQKEEAYAMRYAKNLEEKYKENEK